MGTACWDGVQNVRDLGGLPLRRGGTTMPGVIIRSGALDGLTTAGRRQLLALEPARIIDLRSPHEITQPSPLAGHPAFRHLPFVDPARDAERDPSSERSRSDLYRGSLHRNGRHVARIFSEIAAVEHGPVVVHCKSGVDRTGMLVALLLCVAGVDRETVIRDYATDPGRDPRTSVATGSAKDSGRPDWAGTPPDADTMAQVLDWLDREYGGATGYLSQHGVAEGQIRTVRQRLTRPASSPA
jgi:hypothetical protein